MISLSPLWWLLLPIFGLPIWWHRQRRHTQKIQTLATAKFLPSAPPQLLRVWRWRDIVLLLLRCLMLLTLIAILAGLFWSWRGDTVFVGNHLDEKWVQQTLQKSGFEHAKQMRFCAETKFKNTHENHCDIYTDDLFFWIEQQQAQWQTKARWLVLASADQLSMHGQKPVLTHDVLVRIAPLDTNKQTNKTPVFVSIKSTRMAEWRRLFSAFEEAGTASQPFVLSEHYGSRLDARSEAGSKAGSEARPDLVVWDQPSALDATWQAPLIWQTTQNVSAKVPAVAADLQANLNEKNVPNKMQGAIEKPNAVVPIPSSLSSLSSSFDTLKISTSIQNNQHIWTVQQQTDWPLNNVENAKKLFEAWQSVRKFSVPFPSQDIAADKNAKVSLIDVESALQIYLLYFFILLLVLERSLAHVRRS